MIAAATETVVKLWNVDAPLTSKVRATKTHGVRSGNNTPPDAPEPIYELSCASSESGIGLEKTQCLSLSNKGNLLAVGGQGGQISIVGLENDTIDAIPIGKKTGSVVDVGFIGKESESLILANSLDMRISVWDRAKRRITENYEGPKNPLSCMALSGNSKFIATATKRGGEVFLFNREQRTKTEYKLSTKQPIHGLDLSPGFRTSILVGSDDGSLHLFDSHRSVPTPTRVWQSAHDAPVRGVAYSPIERRIAYSVGFDKCVKRVDDAMRSGVNLFADVGTPLTSVACDSVLGWVAVGSIDGQVRIYDTRNAKQPFWKSVVEKDKSVLSISLSASSPTLSRSSTSSRSRSSTTRAAVNSSDEADPLERLVKSRVVSSASYSSAPVGSRPDTQSRPPTHPSAPTTKRPVPIKPKSSTSRPPVPTGSVTSPPTLHSEEPTSPPVTKPSAALNDLANASVFQKDRSYMELFSPSREATSRPSVTRDQPAKVTEDNILKGLDSPPKSATRADSPPKDPIDNICGPRPTESVLKTPPPATAGDSIMELFTPKDSKRQRQFSVIQGDLETKNSMESQGARAGILASNITRTTDPLPNTTDNKSSYKESQPKESAVTSPNYSNMVKPSQKPSPFPQPVTASQRPTSHREAQPPQRNLEEVVSKAHTAVETATATIIPSTNQPQARVVQNNISTDLIQQAVQDSLSPFCQQIRNDMLNLHLDIIRQNNEQRHQLDMLYQVCEEAKVLRKEVERLSLENERLRRYLPYCNLVDGEEEVVSDEMRGPDFRL